MADHVAEQIIVAAKALLTGATTAGANVFDSRVYEVNANQVPALLIDQGEEAVKVESLGANRVLARALELIIVAKAKQNTSYRTMCNTLRKEVESLLAQNNSLGGLCKWINPSSAVLELSGDADNPVASMVMTFEAVYFTTIQAPDVPM